MLSQPDSEFVKRNRRLPGLAFLLDTGFFSEYMEKNLPEIKIDPDGAGYIRYKPGTNCLVSYSARYRGMKSYIYATTYAECCLNKLEKARRGILKGGDAASNKIIVDRFCSVVSIFPFDRKLHSLHKLSDRERRERLFDELLPGRSAGRSLTLTGLRYKPERRFVGKLVDGNSRNAAGIVKFYRKEDFKSAKIAAASFTSAGNLIIPELLSCSEKNHALIFRWVSEKPLEEIIYEESFNSECLGNVAKALNEIHSARTPHLPEIYPEQETRSISETASVIALTIPSFSEKSVLLSTRISNLLGKKRIVNTPVHGDFYAGQVLTGNGASVAIVDFDRAALGDPARDIGTFFAHLERDFVKGKITGQRLSEFKKAFLTGYTVGYARDFNSRVCLYTASELFRLSQEPFRHREREWTNSTLLMLDRVESLLYELKGKTQVRRLPIPVNDPYGVLTDQPYPMLKGALTPGIVERGMMDCRNKTLAKTRITAVRVIRYKLLRRCMIEYDLTSVQPEGAKQTTVIGKIRFRGLDISSYLVQTQLYSGIFGSRSRDEILVPEPLGIIPDLNMLLYKKVDGVPLTEVLLSEKGGRAARQAARAAFKLHTSSVSPQRIHTISDELKTLEEKLPLVTKQIPEAEIRINRIIALSKLLAASIPEPVLAPVHRDFYSDQLIAGEKNIYLLDFDLFALGDPALDTGNFIGHVREQSLRTFGDPDAMSEAVQAFRDEYMELSGINTGRSIDAYTLLTMVRHIYISTLFSDRRKSTLPLIELCEKEIRAFIS